MTIKFPRGGYLEKILRVDLSEKRITEEPINRRLLEQYVGGTGLGIRLLYDETIPGLDPYDARNHIIFTTGPLTGTLVPGSGTYSVLARNTLTGLVSACQSNGFFGARLKYAGYDVLIIQGRSEKLVYLCINDGTVSIEDAAPLAGKGAFATDLWLRKKYGEEGVDHQISVAAIGPAGENRVRFACLVSDHGHIAATGGLGAIMGSKGLKAIVVQGNQPIPIAREDRNAFLEAVIQWRQEAQKTVMGKTVNALGTIGFFSNLHANGWVPVKNLSTNLFPGAEKFGGDYIRHKVFKGVPRACHNCTFKHCHTVQVTRGPYKGIVGEEVEYEILAGFGPNWGIYDPGTTTMLNTLNDDLGMDAKESAFLISMIMEGVEKGIISKQGLDGLDICWGKAEVAAEMLRRISRREGIGNLLAEGVMRASERLGGEFPNIAVYVKKGNAPHIHDPRTRWGTLFNQVVSDMGSQEGLDIAGKGFADLGIEKPATEPDEYLGEINAKTEWWRQFHESLTYCFYQNPSINTMLKTLNHLTGSAYNMDTALKTGRRIVNLLRMFNIREGMTKDHDSFSPRLSLPPIDGPGKGKSLAPSFEKVRAAFYMASGWDQEGRPARDLLEELDLGFAIKDLRV